MYIQEMDCYELWETEKNVPVIEIRKWNSIKCISRGGPSVNKENLDK